MRSQTAILRQYQLLEFEFWLKEVTVNKSRKFESFKRQPPGFLLLAMQSKNTGYLRSSQPAAIWASRHAYVLPMSIRALHGRNALLIYTGLRRFTLTGGLFSLSYLICRIFDWQIIFLQKKIACRIYAGSIAWIFVCILDVIMLYFLIWETKDRKGGLPPLLHYLFYFTGGGFIAFS